jgi:hypothetical protein
MLVVLLPVTLVLVAVTLVSVNAAALADTVEEISLVLVTVSIEGGGLASAASGCVLVLTVLRNELVFAVSVLCHGLEFKF